MTRTECLGQWELLKVRHYFPEMAEPVERAAFEEWAEMLRSFPAAVAGEAMKSWEHGRRPTPGEIKSRAIALMREANQRLDTHRPYKPIAPPPLTDEELAARRASAKKIWREVYGGEADDQAG